VISATGFGIFVCYRSLDPADSDPVPYDREYVVIVVDLRSGEPEDMVGKLIK
jgi:hypothetical protein